MGKSTIEVPVFGQPVKTMEEFYLLAKDIAHFAIKRSLGYFHHFIIFGMTNAKNQTIEYYGSIKNFFTGPGEVVKHDTSKNEIEDFIAKGNLYAIEAPNYPKTEQEIQEAKERYSKRLAEKAYQLACNNCEHLVSYIMTGIPYSEQIANASACKKGVVDLCDCLVSHGKRNGIKMILNAIAVIPISFIANEAVNQILAAASSLSPCPLLDPCIAVDMCTNNFITFACHSSIHTKLEVLASKSCVAAACCATRKAVVGTALSSAAVAAVFETIMAAYGIRKVYKLKKSKFISERNFKREVTKTVLQAICATIGSVGGGVIGQTVIPIPILGFAIGSFLGNTIGRLFGCFIAGQVFDWSHKNVKFPDENDAL